MCNFKGLTASHTVLGNSSFGRPRASVNVDWFAPLAEKEGGAMRLYLKDGWEE